MLKILHIDSSIQYEGSVSRYLSAEIVRALSLHYPAAQISYRDTIAQPVMHLDGAIASGFRPGIVADTDNDIALQHRLSGELADEFLASDVLVIGAPMYNFSIASQLKAWFDRIAQPGKTFRYTEQGPVGLAGGKIVIVISARGGFYTEAPLKEFDHQEQYLQTLFRFLGVTQMHFLRAEGTSKGEEIQSRALNHALAAIPELIATLNLREG